MNEREAYVQRLAQVRHEVPRLFDARSVLYIGATPRRFQLGQELYEAGCQITLLEAHKPFADHYQGHPWLAEVIHGDVLDIPTLFGGRAWDAAVWWHGPEHVERDRLARVLAELEKRVGLVVLGCPWGQNAAGVIGGNPYSRHAATLDTADLEGLGYRTATLGTRDRPDTWCHILAWKQPGGAIGVVYTAVFGDYDQLRPATGPGRYVCFSDADVQADGWEIVRVSRLFESSRREARMYKVLAHQWFDVDVSIWQDGNGQLLVQSDDLVRYLAGHDLAFFAHPERDCVYQEAGACIELRKADPDLVMSQVESYRRHGYPERNGLAATGLVVRRHSARLAAFEDAWWSELTRHTLRDQLSLDYVCWRLGMEYAVIPGYLWENDVINWQQHRSA